MGLLKNTLWGMIGDLALRASKVVQVAVVVRYLGPQQYGEFNHAFSVATMFVVLFDFGTSTVAVREFSKDVGRREVLWQFGVLKLFASALGWMGLTLWVWWSFPQLHERWLIVVMGLYLWLGDLGSYVLVAYRARQEFWKETLFRSFSAVVQLVVSILCLILGGDVLILTGALAFSTVLFLLPLLREMTDFRCVTKISVSAVGSLAKECLPIVGTAVAATVYMNADVVVLAKYVPMAEVGWYSAAVKTVFSIFTVPIQYFLLASLPAHSSEMAHNTLGADATWWRHFALTTYVGAVFALAVLLSGSILIRLIFGEAFLPTVRILAVFALPCFLFYLHTPLAQWALIHGRQSMSAAVYAIALAVNVGLLLWLVPIAGALGAAEAVVVTHGVLVLGHLLIARSIKSKPNGNVLIMVVRSAIGVLAAWSAIIFFPHDYGICYMVAASLFLFLTFRQTVDGIRMITNKLKGIWFGIHLQTSEEGGI